MATPALRVSSTAALTAAVIWASNSWLKMLSVAIQLDCTMAAMRIDLYTKVLLTVIVGLLGVIALRPYVGPDVVQAQGAFSGVQFTNDKENKWFFDTRTGNIWY